MSRVRAASLLLRRYRMELGVLALVMAVVGVTSFLGTAAPRLYDRVADAGIRSALRDAPASFRTISLTRQLVSERPRTLDDLLAREGETDFGRFGGRIRESVAARELVATSPRFTIDPIPRYQAVVRLRAQTGLDGAIRFTAGRMPVSTGSRLPPVQAVEPFGPPPDRPPSGAPTRVEVAFSETTAEEAGFAVGQVFEADLDGTDAAVSDLGPVDLPLEFEVVGIFAIDDPNAVVWNSDNRLEHVGVAQIGEDQVVVYPTALMAPDALGDLVTSALPFTYQWRYPIEPDRLDAERATALVPELRQLETTFSGSAVGRGADAPRLRADLLSIIERFSAQLSSSTAVLSVAAIGPLVLGAAAIGVLALLLARRRRAGLEVTRARGASNGTLLLTQAWEGTIVAGSAALAGYLAAVALVPGRPSVVSGTPTILIGVGAVVVLMAPVLAALRRPIRTSGREMATPTRLAPRRLVLELTVVGLAIVGVVLLDQRGLTIGPAGRTEVRFDPFLAAVPMLVGFAAGLALLRLYPIPVRGLSALTTRRRDLVPAVGLWSIGRRPSSLNLPLLVLFATAAFASFALVTSTGIERGQRDASWLKVGADYRIEAPFDGSLDTIDVERVEGVEAVARAYFDPTAGVRASSFSSVLVPFKAIDPAAYERVVGGDLAPGLPSELQAPPGADPGSRDEPIPAVVSRAMAASAEPIAAGDTLDVRFDGKRLAFRIVAIRDRVPGLTDGDRFIVAPLAHVTAALGSQAKVNRLYVRAPASSAAGIAAALAGRSPVDTTVVSRHAWLADLHSSPLLEVVAQGFIAGLAIAVGYATIAIITSIVLSAARRNQDLAFLRALGLTQPQAAGIMIVEHGLPILLAVVPGLVAGIAIALLLERDLGLDAFLGDVLAYRVQIDWLGVAGVAGLLAAIVTVSVVVGTIIARRARIIDALRLGEL